MHAETLRKHGTCVIAGHSEHIAHSVMLYFWIAIGSAIGGVGRYWCNNLVSSVAGDAFPWGTISVNVAGSFLIGFLASIDPFPGRSWLPGPEARAFLIVGVCGGYTTFSAFSLQTLDLLRIGQWPEALGNIALSVLLCLLAVWLGHLACVALGPSRPG